METAYYVTTCRLEKRGLYLGIEKNSSEDACLLDCDAV